MEPNKKIDVAKLVRCILPQGAFSALNLETGEACERVCDREKGFVCFCLEGQSDSEVVELTDYERSMMDRMHGDLKEAHGCDVKPTHKLRFPGPVVIVTEDGWEMYPSFTYYSVGTIVAQSPERGFSIDLAKIMFRRDDIESEQAEISEGARNFNIRMSAFVLLDAAQRRISEYRAGVIVEPGAQSDTKH